MIWGFCPSNSWFEMELKPLGGQIGRFFERSGLLKQVRCPGDKFQALDALQFREGLLIEPDHFSVPLADDQ